jgi:hypothetical protein
MNTPLLQFIEHIEYAWSMDSFIKLALGNYTGEEKDLKNIYIKKIRLKDTPTLSFTFRFKTRDIVKNHSFEEGKKIISDYLVSGFKIATLFTSEFDFIFEELLNKKTRIRKQNATAKANEALSHDRIKNRPIVAENKAYLHALEITDNKGNVYKTAQDKYKQINHFIELLSPLLKEMPERNCIKVADMGAGKGYLTFALYDYLTSVLHKEAEVKGIEWRKDLVDFCNTIALQSGFKGLQFESGSISDFDCTGQNVLIALHACDTATDDAIIQGIKAGSDLIVVAPCCHKQIRKQIEKNKVDNNLTFILKHGLFLERQAEMITDGIRSLIMEYFGYKIKVIDFIADTHTPKNVMLVGLKSKTTESRQQEILKEIKEAKRLFGIDFHYLEQKLALAV